jgi:hypothetical protein
VSIGAVITAVEAELATVGITKRTGAPEVQTNDTVPRVVWVPVRERIAPPVARMGEPGCIWVRTVTIEAHLWGATLAQCEGLIDDVARAFNAACKGQFAQRMIGAQWDIDQKFDNFGQLVVLGIEVDIPIERTGSTWAEVEEWPTTLIVMRAAVPPPNTDGTSMEIAIP